MNSACWNAAADGRYLIDIALGSVCTQMMIDTGLVDPVGKVVYETDPVLFDSLVQSGQLVSVGLRSRRDASGRTEWLKVGSVTGQLLDPKTNKMCGAAVSCLALRNRSGVPNRVGLVFFHHLAGCRVVWDLDARIWSVEYP